MSEQQKMNTPLSRENLPPEVASALHQLELEPLKINRDELFFQAGFAAGVRRRGGQHFWPVLAAALLLISVGLSAVLLRQTSEINSLSTALAVAPTESANKIALGTADSPQRAEQDQVFAQQPRNWQRLASVASLPPGRLTAMGWEELPPEAVQAESAIESTLQNSPPNRSTKPNSAPHHPATYLELMRQQREG